MITIEKRNCDFEEVVCGRFGWRRRKGIKVSKIILKIFKSGRCIEDSA